MKCTTFGGQNKFEDLLQKMALTSKKEVRMLKWKGKIKAF